MKAFSENENDFFDLAKFNKESSLNLAKSLNKQWQEICIRFLPIPLEETIWRYGRIYEPDDPDQGWKLHISATILNAPEVLETIAPFLKSEGALFKAPVSIREIKKINSGIYYNYSQIGKIITIYPQTNEQAVFFAEQLHCLTEKFAAPDVPFDFQFKPESSVYYRYGAFKTFELKDADGSKTLAMHDRDGKLIPDLRYSQPPYPEWISNPFPVMSSETETSETPLTKNYKVFGALSQRGKGGVYQAVDFSTDMPRFCLVKEGRKNGEVDWDGRDGFWRVRYESYVLKILREAGINVPQIYSSFETAKNFYLVTEFIEGETLYAFLQKRERRLSVSQAIKYAIQLSSLIAQIHSAGWLWRDCKPGNLILCKDDSLRPIDFEGACAVNQPDYVWYSTLTPALFEESEIYSRECRINPDLFALGAIIYLLFEGELPNVTSVDGAPQMLRRKVPNEIKLLVSKLLNPNPTKYPTAKTVTQKLRWL
ncbi:MAG TPA: protein kinase [Pyrinomonadaceae bacterium]